MWTDEQIKEILALSRRLYEAMKPHNQFIEDGLIRRLLLVLEQYYEPTPDQDPDKKQIA